MEDIPNFKSLLWISKFFFFFLMLWKLDVGKCNISSFPVEYASPKCVRLLEELNVVDEFGG